MSSVNLGSQKITFDYQQPAKADEFNALLKNLIKPGFYSGGEVTNQGNDITIAPFKVHVDCSNNETLSVDVYTTESITQTALISTNTYFVLNYAWINSVENWLNFEFKKPADVLDTDIIISVLTFSGTTVVSTSDNLKTRGLFNEDYEIASDLIFSRTTESSSETTGAVVLKGGLGIAKNLSVKGVQTNYNTTESNSKSTGALVVKGGIGVEKDIYAGGEFYSDNMNIRLKHWPVGAIYESVESTSPATLFGGTWSAFGAGRVLVGINATDTEFDTVEEEYGAKTHALSVGELASHQHETTVSDAYTAYFGRGQGLVGGNYNGNLNAGVHLTNATGSGTAHNNIQPSIVVYRWKRTA